MLLLAQEVTADAAMAAYREKMRADVRCKESTENEIVVCALREADRYRVPFVERGAGREAAEVRVARLFQNGDPVPCGQGAFLVHCGKVGVTMTANATGAHLVQRPLAP
ncbi:hypothetical protein ACG3SL_17245 [Sphingomonas sp. CJ20]